MLTIHSLAWSISCLPFSVVYCTLGGFAVFLGLLTINHLHDRENGVQLHLLE